MEKTVEFGSVCDSFTEQYNRIVSSRSIFKPLCCWGLLRDAIYHFFLALSPGLLPFRTKRVEISDQVHLRCCWDHGLGPFMDELSLWCSHQVYWFPIGSQDCGTECGSDFQTATAVWSLLLTRFYHPCYLLILCLGTTSQLGGNKPGHKTFGLVVCPERRQFSLVAQSCPTLYNPMNCSTPGLPVRHQSPGVHSNSCPSSRWCHPAISSSVIPFSSYPKSLPASESFPMSQLFTWGGQSIGVSALASVLPKKSQGWSPSEWTGWISLQSKGLSRVFSNTTVQKHQFFEESSAFFTVQLSHPYMTTGKTRALTRQTMLAK